MGFFKNAKAKWKAMSAKEKMQAVVVGICDIGADLLAGLVLCRLVPEDEKKWKKAAMIVTAGGLGMWASKAASDQLNGVIDIVWKDKEEEDDDE